MSYHIHKDEIQLTWLDNRDTIKNEIKKIVRRVENELFRQLDDEYTAAVSAGEVIVVRPGSGELETLFKEAVIAALGDDETPQLEAGENVDQ